MKLSKKAFGLTSGILWAAAIFLTTNILLIRGSGGAVISGLEYVYPGYGFNFLGSIIGLVWGFITGFIGGWLFAFLNNLFINKAKS